MRWALLLVAGCAYGQVGHINAGGPAYTDVLGQSWQADNSFVGGAVSTGSIPFGAPPHFATKRYGDFVYNLAVPDGNYTITLSFLENVALPVGGRVFGVTINGAPALTGYDIVADVGANVTVRKSFTTTAASGRGVSIVFKTITRSAIVNGIEIAATPTTATTYPKLEAFEQCSGSGNMPQNMSTAFWSPTTTYCIGVLINYGTLVYASMQEGNIGNQPDISPAFWRVASWDCAFMLRATIKRADGTTTVVTGTSGASGAGTWMPIK